MTTPTLPRIAALVLAAGASTRMGAANKLLAELEGSPLIAHAVDAALASRAAPVVVVTGHDADAVERALAGREVTFARNAEPEQGLSASLRSGLDALDAEIDGALVCLGDMPWLRAEHLDALLHAFGASALRPICVPVHEGRRGHPVLWPARHFDALRAIEGDTGGRALLDEHAHQLAAVPIADAAIHRDVDTPDDLPR